MLKSIFPLSILTFLSRVCGFIREVVLYRALGGTLILDAFLIAFRLPNQTRRFFAEGSFNQALLPQIAHSQEQNQYDTLLYQAFQFLSAVMGLFSLSTYFFPEFWICLVAPGLAENKISAVAKILQYTGFYAFFMSISAFYGTVLQIHKKLYPIALAPVITNIFLIATLVTFFDQVSSSILGSCVFFAGFTQCFYLYKSAYFFRHKTPSEYQKQFSLIYKQSLIHALVLTIVTYTFTLQLSLSERILFFALASFCFQQLLALYQNPSPLFLKTLRNFFKLSSVGGLILFNTILDLRYISGYGSNAFSYWNLCERITDLPFGVLVSSLSIIFTSHYVTLYKNSVSKVHLELKACLFILIFVVPCTLGLAAMAEPITHIFYSDDSLIEPAASLLAYFSLGIIPLTLNKIYLSIAIVRSKQNLILGSHFVGSVANAFFNYLFDAYGWQIFGILFSTLITVSIQALIFEYYVPFALKVFRLPLKFFFTPFVGFLFIACSAQLIAPYLCLFAKSLSVNSFWQALVYPMSVLGSCSLIAVVYLMLVYPHLIWLAQDFKQPSENPSKHSYQNSKTLEV